jgi:YD repeat-containing protein
MKRIPWVRTFLSITALPPEGRAALSGGQAPDLRRLPAAALRAAWLAGGAAGLAALAPAHTVTPAQLTLRPGSYDYIVVTDQGTCSASITVSTDRPDLLDVCLDSGSGPICGCGTEQKTAAGISQTFFICAAPTDPNGQPWQGTQHANVLICWVGFGQDLNGNPCTEDNCSLLPEVVPVQVVPYPVSTGQQPNSGRTPDPINTHTGELFFTEPPDLVLRGPLPLVFQRYYASNLAADGNASSPLGANWLHNFSWKLAVVGNGVEVVTPRGKVLVFEQPQPGTYSLLLPTEVAYRLAGGIADYRLADPTSDLAYVFDLSGRLTGIEDGKGGVLTLTYGGVGGLDLLQVSDGLGRALDFTYLGSGLLDTVGDGTRTVSFGYGASLETVVDAAGETTTYAYDAGAPQAARLVSRTDATGRTQSVQAYDGAGRVATQTNAYAGALALAYPGAGGGNTVLTDALGNDSVHAHAASGELTGATDEGGNSVGYAYDSSGRRISWTDRLGSKTQWAWDASSGKLGSFTAANGAKTTFGYAPRSSNGLVFHDLVSIGLPGGGSQVLARDAAGNVTSLTDPAGGAWSFTYSAGGLLLTAVNPLGGVHTFTYTADGDLDTWTDPSGDLTSFGYDGLHRLTSVTHPDGTSSSATYDELDRVLATTNANGETTSYVWDEAGRLVQRTDADGNPVAWSYDAMGWLQARTDGTDGGATWLLSRDDLGRVLSQVDPGGASSSFDHDAIGNLVGVTPSSGGLWSIDPDDESATDGITDPLGNTWNVTTNEMAWTTRVESPEARVRRANYDALGRTTRLFAPDGNSVGFAYTQAGWLEGTYGPIGSIATMYERDGLGLVTVATDANGGEWESIRDSDGLRTQLIDPLERTTVFARDQRDRIAQVTLPDLSTIDVTRDGNGRPIMSSYSTGSILLTSYTDTGRIQSAHNVALAYDAAGNVIDSNGIGIVRDPAGRMTSLNLGPGKTVTYEWGLDDRVDLIRDWFGAETDVTWTADDLLESVSFPNGVTVTFTYDDDGNPTGIDFGGLGSIGLQLGPRGEVLRADRTLPLLASPPLGSANCAYDIASQLLAATYDLRGRTLGVGGYTYSWGPRYAASLSDGVSTVDFEHDAFGQLTRRTVGGTIEDFTWIYGLERPVLGVVGRNGAPAWAVVPFVDGTPLYTVDWNTGTRSFLHCDEGGSVVMRTDDSGAVTDSYVHDPFGNLLAESGATLDDTFTFRAAYGWLREEATVSAALHYHHGDGGGFYRADEGRDLAPAFDPDDLLSYRYSPYVPEYQFRDDFTYYVGAHGPPSSEPERDLGGSFAYLSSGLFLYSDERTGDLDGLGYFDDYDSTEPEPVATYFGDFRNRWQLQANLSLQIPNRAVPASNRATAKENAGGSLSRLTFAHRFMASAFFEESSFDFVGEEGEEEIRISASGVADNGLAYGAIIDLNQVGEARRGEEIVAIRGKWGSLDLSQISDDFLDRPVSPPPKPENVTYFSPRFAGFQAAAAFDGTSDGVLDEIDAFDALSKVPAQF